MTKTMVCFFLLILLASEFLFSAHYLENDNLRVTVTTNGSLKFQDKQYKTSWGYEKPGWATVIKDGRSHTCALENSDISVNSFNNQLLLTFSKLTSSSVNDEKFEMRIQIKPSSTFIDIEIISVASSFPLEKIEYPAHILNVKSGVAVGYIVVPNLQGILIPSRYDAGFMRYGQNIWDMIADQEHVWSFESGMLNMPWFGASVGTSSILATVKTPSDCQLRVIGNSVVGDFGRTVNTQQAQHPGTRMSSLTPIWLSSRGQLSFPSILRLEPVDNSYVGMAKRYRDYAKESGRYVTMKDKIQST